MTVSRVGSQTRNTALPARHPVPAFTVLAYAISWICWLPLLADRQDRVRIRRGDRPAGLRPASSTAQALGAERRGHRRGDLGRLASAAVRYHATYQAMPAIGFLGFFFSLLIGAFVLAWLYLRSRGAILVVAVFHAASDIATTTPTTTTLVPTLMGAVMTLAGLAVIPSLARTHPTDLAERSS